MQRWIVLLLLSAMSIRAVADDFLPVETFAQLPQYGQVQLSPDGSKVAALVKIDMEDMLGTAIQVGNLETGKSEFFAYAPVEKYRVNWIRWANNSQVLMSARFPAKRQGTPTTETRLLRVSVLNGEIASVFSRQFLRKQTYFPQFQDEVVDVLPDDEEHILIAGSFRSISYSDIYKVSLQTGRVKRVLVGKEYFDSWLTDRNHEVRISVYRKDTEFRIMHRPAGGKKWNVLWEYEAFSEDAVRPLGFDADPNILYINAYHEGRQAIFKVDLSDSGLRRELVFSNPYYDAGSSLIYSRKSRKIVGTRFSTQGGFTFWDDEYLALQKGLNAVLPDTSNTLFSLSDNERRYIVLASSDTEPGKYYVGDRDSGTMTMFANRYADLDSATLADKKYIEYEARDGLVIGGYLTVPAGAGPYPTIIFPHGGPISFDDGGFDYWTQYFASRGYAVLQMNFRGSAGQGYDFMKAGLKSWGLDMQNDVEDGTRWMLDEGLADPERICVVGASYGGYAALMEAARNPDLYRCAVSFAGVTDLAYLVSVSRRYTNYDVVKEQIGSNRRDLKARSPITLAEDIELPILLAHGTDDRRVRVRHSVAMYRALKKHDKVVDYLEFNDGDHFLSNQDHRIEFFKAMDGFLANYLSPQLGWELPASSESL